MRHGFVVPFADSRQFAELAALGEEHGWDAVFTWEAVHGVDAWVSLAAAAMATERIRLATLLTPASRVRPWDLASRVGSVDRLSGGRVTVSVGLGALHDGWLAYEPDEGRRARAQKLDECLRIATDLLRDGESSYRGEHYAARPTDFLRPPVGGQRPHPPIWVVGGHKPGASRQRSLERAARWQGLIPSWLGGEEANSGMTLERFRVVTDEVRGLREGLGLPWEGYDVVVEADTFGDFGTVRGDPQAWQDAGATWWVESWWDLPEGDAGRDEVRRRLTVGPRR